MAPTMRRESDALGQVSIPADALYGIHQQRARDAFGHLGGLVSPRLLRAYGAVKLACWRCNAALGYGHDAQTQAAVEAACEELITGDLHRHLPLAALQGGAGTATNLAVNEVLCNRALGMLGLAPGPQQRLQPLRDLNRHQSTNDTYPTALRVAALQALQELEAVITALQNTLHDGERRWQEVVKVGRTQLQDACYTTVGRSFGAWAEAIARDRWRLSKCAERLRLVNLGGTAIGSGLGAPREFIFRVVDVLRAVTGLRLARAENLSDATQHHDALVEVSGMLSAAASNLMKIAGDLRLLASGPHAGLAELRLPPQLTGSSIMPGKVNPVIPEMVQQAAMQICANHQTITQAVGMGSLELNPFMPLIADRLLASMELLTGAAEALDQRCLRGLEINHEHLARQVSNSTVSLATALAGHLGHEAVEGLLADGSADLGERACAAGLLSAEDLQRLSSAAQVLRLGSPSLHHDGEKDAP
ncbi:MAG: aspartate ammonia-lyase [Planctomycetota bacterium]|nr:MAG: aspartate ammonia-lyase [Planctomycetota bacterium]